VTRPGRYRYVGPADLRVSATAIGIVAANSPEALAGWLDDQDPTELIEPVTFVVMLDGVLWLAPRRSEHVALARGRDVLAAGEMTFVRVGSGWQVAEVTNQSTGYCPDPDSWPAVGRALDGLGIPHPDDFTERVVFRRCPACGQRNIVREDDFVCALCDGVLPVEWNFISP
jgi:hypothetical protein